MKKFIISIFFIANSLSIYAETDSKNQQNIAKPKAITLLKSDTDWSGKTLPKFPSGQPEITVFKGVIPPGAIAPMHTHPVIGSYYVLKGNLTVRTETGEVLHATPGNAYNEVVNKWHWGKNEGEDDVEIIFFYAGSKETINSILKQLE